MQFLPGTWSRYASDGNGDGKADVQNVFDASLAAARYLCSGGLNLRGQSQVMTAILRYNNSMAYAQNVLGWAAAYATGVVPVDLPPITGPIPPIADVHLDNYQGLGPGLPMNVLGLPADDPLAMVPLVNMGRTDVGQPDVRAASWTGAGGCGMPAMPGMPARRPCRDARDDAAGTCTGPAAGMAPPQQNCAVFCIGTNPPAAVQPQLPPEALPPGICPTARRAPELTPLGPRCRTRAATRRAMHRRSRLRPLLGPHRRQGRRPARLPDRRPRPRANSARPPPPTLGGDVRTSQ